MRSALLLPILALLAGCGEAALVDQRDASIDQVLAAATAAGADQAVPAPGRWETRVTLGDFNAAGLEATLFAGLWDPASRSVTATSCVLPDTGARPDLAMLAKAGRDCRYDRFRMGATTIEAQMTCKPSETRRVYIAMNGTYAPDHFQMYLKADAPGKTPDSERIQFSTSINAIRNGPCRGGEAIVTAPAMVAQAQDLASPPDRPPDRR